ncbi:hypothetical protein ONZ45_g16332 [Pleurotus djamor]|nr:hypothetical protein ONZ45_g16332 [Pleurotus djamor]
MSTSEAASVGWFRFKEVTFLVPRRHRLFRASSPNYFGFDASLSLTPEAVRFLEACEIDSLVSFNSQNYTENERASLKAAGIEFLHVPVKDFTAATPEQLDAVYQFFLENRATLLHCGYGHGRTGTGVTAIQLYATSGQAPPEDYWQAVNHVEKEEQMDALRSLKARLQQSATRE